MSQINIDRLPALLRALVRVLGERRAFRLVERRGGGRLIVPNRVTVDHPLLEDIDPEGFVLLVENFRNQTLDLPKYDGVLRQHRHKKVRALRGKGMTMDRIAVETGYTRRHVINVLEADDSLARLQLDMFDEPVPAAAVAAAEPDASPARPAAPRAHDPFGLAWRGPAAADDLD